MPCVPECQRRLRANVLACQRGLRINVTACQRAKSLPVSHFYVPTCQRAIRRPNVLTWRANVPNGGPIFQLGMLTYQEACQFFNLACQRAKRRANFQTFLFEMLKKIYRLYYYVKNSTFFFDIIVVNIICICIILHFYTSCHIKEKCVEFFFFIIFLSFVRN